MSEALLPEQPIEPIDNGGGGGDDGGGGTLPPTVSITQISPIAAGLAGGIEVTLSGSSFQFGAQVFSEVKQLRRSHS